MCCCERMRPPRPRLRSGRGEARSGNWRRLCIARSSGRASRTPSCDMTLARLGVNGNGGRGRPRASRRGRDAGRPTRCRREAAAKGARPTARRCDQAIRQGQGRGDAAPDVGRIDAQQRYPRRVLGAAERCGRDRNDREEGISRRAHAVASGRRRQSSRHSPPAAAEQENDALAEKLHRQQQQLRDGFTSRDETIRELNKLLARHHAVEGSSSSAESCQDGEASAKKRPPGA